MSLIVTHNGPAHRDEFLACCILLANGNTNIARNSAPDFIAAALTDPHTFVVDIGLKHEPALRNFDHHQLPADAPATCALSLVLQHVTNLDMETLRDLAPWLEFTEVLDSKGPRAAAKLVGIEGTAFDKFFSTMSPIESIILNMFSQRSYVYSGDELGAIMFTIGKSLLDGIIETRNRLGSLPKMCDVYLVNNLTVADLRNTHFGDRPLLGLELYLKRNFPDTAVTVSQHERNPGCLCVFRRNDHPSVDFTRIKNLPGTVFAHANGFMAVINPAEVTVKQAIEASIV